MTHSPLYDPDAPMPSRFTFCKTPGCPEILIDSDGTQDPLCTRCRREFESFCLESLAQDDYIPLEDLIATN